MKKKLTALLAMSLCATTLLAACGNPEDGVYSEAALGHTYTKMTKLSNFDGYELSNANGPFAHFVKTEGTTMTTVVYNMNTEKRVYEKTYAATSYRYFVTLTDDAFAVTVDALNEVGEQKSKEIFVYNDGGTQLVKKTVDDVVEGSACQFYDLNRDEVSDYVKLNDEVYKRKEGTKKKPATFEYSFDASGQVHDFSSGTFVENKIIEKDGNCVYTYNVDNKLLHAYEIPSYATVNAFIVLDNARFVVQYTYQVDDFAKKYDYFDGGNKYNIETKCVDPEKDSERDIDCEYVLSNDYYTESDFADNGSIDGYAAVVEVDQKIVDERLQTLTHSVIFGMTTKGKIKERDEIIDNQNMAQITTKIFGYYYVEDIAGQGYLLDEDGEVKKEISARKLEDYNAKFIVYDGKIYNKALKELKLPGDAYRYHGLLDNEILLSKTEADGEVIYKWSGSGTNVSVVGKNNATETFTTGGVGFVKSVIANMETSYTYYNTSATALVSNLKHTLQGVATNNKNTVKIYKGQEPTATGTKSVYYLAK